MHTQTNPPANPEHEPSGTATYPGRSSQPVSVTTASTPAQRVEDAPLDIAAMRKTAAPTLDTGAALPRYDDLQDTVLLLRGHLNLLVPEIEGLARALPDGHPMRAPALVAAAHARVQLDAGPGPGLVSAANHAKALARHLRTLCGHYETFSTAAVQAGPAHD